MIRIRFTPPRAAWRRYAAVFDRRGPSGIAWCPLQYKEWRLLSSLFQVPPDPPIRGGRFGLLRLGEPTVVRFTQ